MSGLSKLRSRGPGKEVALGKGLLSSSLQTQYRFFHRYQKAAPGRRVSCQLQIFLESSFLSSGPKQTLYP